MSDFAEIETMELHDPKSITREHRAFILRIERDAGLIGEKP